MIASSAWNTVFLQTRTLRKLLGRASSKGRKISWKTGGENLTMLLPAVLWREENIANEVSNLANEVFKQSIEDAAWFLLESFSKM